MSQKSISSIGFEDLSTISKGNQQTLIRKIIELEEQLY